MRALSPCQFAETELRANGTEEKTALAAEAKPKKEE